jgi:short-subunit dehydrogenase
MIEPRSILITGGSSGVGKALALAYAREGVSLRLGGRDAGRLAAVTAVCQAEGAAVDATSIDVTDADGMARWIAECDDRQPLDLVVANAGVSAGTGGTGESAEQIRRIFRVNVDGVLNTVLPIVPRMIARRRGQIAIMSSLAAFRGMPGAPAYSAGKAAVKVFGEALRGDLARHGVSVTVICPGYIETPMTARNRFPMPFLMSAERGARIIVRGLARNRARIAFPWPMAVAVWLLQGLPPAWTDPLLARLPRKAAE